MAMAGGALNAIGTIGGGIAGTMANNSAQKQKSQAEMMNALMQMNQDNQANTMSLRNLQAQQMGTTDGSGTRTIYDPDQGWRVFMSPQQEQLMRGQEAEQLKSIFSDAATQRSANDREYGDSWDAAQIVDNLTREFNASPRVTAAEERNRTMGDALTGIQGAFDEATNTASRNALRTGGTDISRILADMAKSKAGAVGEAFDKAGTNARASATQQTQQGRANIANLLQAFSQKAGKGYGGSYKPMSVDDNGSMNTSAQLSNSAMAQLLNTLKSSKAPQMDTSHITANQGIGNTITQGFNAFGKMFDRDRVVNKNNGGW